MKPVPSYDGMDEISRGFAEALFTAFPDREPLARPAMDNKTGAHFMEVDVPQSGTNRFLHLSTADNEITIAFDHWHTHVGPFLGSSVVDSIGLAVSMIKAFIAEQTVVKVTRKNGSWIQSILEYVAAPSELKSGTTTRVFSWNRTYDRTIETP